MSKLRVSQQEYHISELLISRSSSKEKSKFTRLLIICLSIGFLFCLLTLINLNGILFAFSLYVKDFANATNPEPPFKTCEVHLTNDRIIQITASYDYSQFLIGANYAFFLTNDRGNTWQKTYSFRLDEPWEPECQNLASLDNKFAWVWIGEAFFFVTHDGGKTWAEWTLSETWSDSEQDCRDRDIQDVEFASKDLGYMKLRPVPKRCQTTELFSDDGGITWRESTK